MAMRNRRRMQLGRRIFGWGGCCDSSCDGVVRLVGVAATSVRAGTIAIAAATRMRECDAARRRGAAHVTTPVSGPLSLPP